MRCGFFYDGFNLYHAISETGQNHLKWTSYQRLSRMLLEGDETLEYVKVFSAFADHLPFSKERHRLLKWATEAEGTKWIMGNFKEVRRKCRGRCGDSYSAHEEKETDVNIALHLLDDCYQGLVDRIFLVTTDSDLAPAVLLCRKRFPDISVTVVNCLRPCSKALLTASGGQKRRISTEMIARCRLPDVIDTPEGFTIRCPDRYQIVKP